MSTATYKHSLRRHVPSGRNNHPEAPSPTPSPPGTPTKSTTPSIKGHHSKREKVKETVDHLLHKFHIPHHHHHDHEHEHDGESQAGHHTPTTPEKRSFFVKRASRRISSHSGKAPSVHEKSPVSSIEVPTLQYDLERSPASSSSSSLDETHSPNDNEPVVDVQVPSTPSIPVVPEPADQQKPAQDVLSTLHKARVQPAAPSSQSLPVEVHSAEPADAEAHHHSKREQVKEAVDHVLHKLHIPHHHRHHHDSEHAHENGPRPISSTSVEDPPATHAQTQSTVEQPAAVASSLDAAEASTTEPVDDHEPKVASAELTPEQAPHPVIIVTEAENGEHDIQADTAEQGEHEVESAGAAVPPEHKEPVSVAPSPVIAEPMVVEDSVKTDDTSSQDSPNSATEQPVISGDDEEPAAAGPSDAPPTAVTPTPPRHPPVFMNVPPLVPPYAELRKMAAANRYQQPRPRLGWFSYIYGSFVRPVAVIAVECTVAVMCYGLVKVFETTRVPASIA